MLIYNAEIHTMDSDEMIPNGWVEVREGKITDIGSGAPNLIPEDEAVVAEAQHMIEAAVAEL